MTKREEFDRRFQKVIRILEEEYGDRVIFSFPVNLDREGERMDGAVIFGAQALYLASDGRNITAYFPFTTMEDARFDGFFGGAACEIKVAGEWMEFCRAFGSEKENISQLVRILKEVADGVLAPEDANFVYRITTCPKCRRALRPGSNFCHACADKKGSAKKLYTLVRPQLGWIILAIALFFLTSGLNVVLPMMQKILVDDFLHTDDPGAVVAAFSTVILVVSSMAVVRILSVIASIFRNVILSKISTRTVLELRRQIYTSIQKLSVSGISRHTAGDLMNRVSADTDAISQFMTNHLPQLLEQGLMILGVSAILFVYSWQMALLILFPVPFVVVMFRLIWSRNHRLYHRNWVELANANTVLHDVFQGIRVVKVFGTEKNEIEKYDRTIQVQRDICVRNEVAWAKVVPFADFIIQIGNFFLLYFAGNRILHGSMTIGELTMFSSFVGLIYSPLRWMANVPRLVQHAMTSVSKVYEVIEEEPDVADHPQALRMDLKGEVSLDSVWFGYSENENVLENVSVSIHPGEMLGIVGRSGVGKSTLINLVMRLYDVNRGAIRMDGVDVRDIAQDSLRSQIGVVLQETFLFAGTIYQNLAYAKPGASFEEVMQAARLANAHSFIMKLPDGYNTFVGERGYTLSGGERQRIAIARAILHDPKILILDEATSALDTETEKLIQDALVRLCKNRTTIAIAHRLSTLRNATKILVLDKKTVAEVGTHEELMEKEDGIYHSLVIAQREMSSLKKKEGGENVSH